AVVRQWRASRVVAVRPGDARPEQFMGVEATVAPFSTKVDAKAEEEGLAIAFAPDGPPIDESGFKIFEHVDRNDLETRHSAVAVANTGKHVVLIQVDSLGEVSYVDDLRQLVRS